MTDRDLIDATLRGDREAFGHVVQRYQRLVEAAAYCATGRHEFVDDIVQDTFITAWRTIERLRDADSLRPWLYGIARNLGLKARRKHGRLLRADDACGPTPTPLDVVVERERDREITAALRGLPDRYREPLVLFYYEHCTVKEVATALAMQEDAAMQRLSRGRRKLGEALAARVESALDSKPTRVAVGAALLWLLPARTVSAAPALAPAKPVTLAKTAAAVTAVGRWLGGQWRLVGAVAGSAAAMGVFVVAIAHSNEVAAHASARASAQPPSHSSSTAPQPPSAPPMPSLIEQNLADTTVHSVITVADLDPVVTCRRGAASLVAGTLGKNSFRRDGDAVYYEPTEELKRLADEAATRAAATCGGDKWPEIYVMCEGTVADMRDGTISCYPYDPFVPKD